MDPLFDAVCVGAHPDDVEIGMGATCAKMAAAGRRVAIVDLTDGEPTPFGSVQKRRAESAAAAEILGVETRRTLTQSNRYLFDTVEARTELAEVLRELRPRMLFVPFAQDAHPDHIAASQIACAARFYSKFTKTEMSGEPFYPPRLFHYSAVHMRLFVRPAFVVECADQLECKIDALRAYESQFSANAANSDLLANIEETARMWGSLSGVGAAEPFFTSETVAISLPDEVL